MRGFAGITLDGVKDKANIGGALRAAHVYGADFISLVGGRYGKYHADTTNAARHIPIFERNSVFDSVPHGCKIVAVDLIEGASPLPSFIHPERAVYIFGGEDRTLSNDLITKCDHVVYVPTHFCMNLSATVNVVLYDRLVKSGKWIKPAKFG